MNRDGKRDSGKTTEDTGLTRKTEDTTRRQEEKTEERPGEEKKQGTREPAEEKEREGTTVGSPSDNSRPSTPHVLNTNGSNDEIEDQSLRGAVLLACPRD